MTTTPVSLKFMTFNLRVESEVDGINTFSKRFGRVLEVIEKERPAVIGFQEAKDGMCSLLREHLTGYTVQGCGRDADCRGEHTLVAYLSDEVELISLDNLWLSPTPYIPGTTFGIDQSKYPRMLTSALLKHRNLCAPFRFINTHFDHIGTTARFLEAMQLCQLLSTYKEKFVLTGDFNATPDTPQMRLITDALSYREVVDCTLGLGGTFHDFGRLSLEERVKIDYIFTDGKCEGAYIVTDIPVNGQYYSDHHAICAYITLE